jgi:hypothetical protein
MASATAGLDKLPLKLSGQITMRNPMDILGGVGLMIRNGFIEAGEANSTQPCHKPPQVDRLLLQ